MKRLLRLLSVWLAVFVLISCSSNPPSETDSPSGTPELASEKVLRIGELWNITSIDPANNGTLITEKALITESLVGIDDNFRIIPALATEWEWIDDHHWRFKLAEGVKFHDGTDFNGEAVQWSVMRAIDTNATVKSISSIVDIVVEADNAVIIETAMPVGDLPEIMHYSNLAILAKSSIDVDGKFIYPVGTGPFMYGSFNESSGVLEVVKYKDYWDGEAQLDKVILNPITDPNTRALSIENGEIDFTIDPPLNEIERLSNIEGLNLEPYNTPRVYVCQLNMNKEPLNDVNVRKALSHALNREAIAEHVLYNIGSPAIGAFSSNIAWVNPDLKGFDYDIETSLALLAEAGYTDSNGDGILDKNGIPLSLKLITYPERPGLPPIAQAMQGYLSEIGIELKLDIMTSSATSGVMDTGDWDIYLMANATTMIPTPGYYLENAFQSGGSASQTTGYSNAEIDALLAQMKSTDDLELKYDLARQVQQIVENDSPLIYVAYYGVGIVMKDSVKNFVFNPTAHDYMLNKEITIEN